MTSHTDPPKRDRWARLRFSIIGQLLAAPPAAGELRVALQALAARTWRHPISGLEMRFGVNVCNKILASLFRQVQLQKSFIKLCTSN